MSAGHAPALGRVVWLAAVIAALWRFDGELPAPPIHSMREIESWYTAAGGEVALLTAVRLGAILVASPLLALAAIRLAELAVVETTRRCIDRAAPGAMRGLARGVAGLSLTAGLTSVPSASQGPTEGEPEVATSAADQPPAPGTATLRRVVDEPASTPPVAEAVGTDVVSSPPSRLLVTDSVVVAHGDSFWSIAEEVVIDRGGPSDERSIARYWEELIAANRDNLVDAGNPDLIHPGQRLTLPRG